ncbi:MAG: hypothetical protein RBR97_12115 [Bacteroidales bacterium]|nr:hypothetical protein [Bacteroidales bacterium]
MKTKPILFSTDMVQAILDGRKTMTRRLSGLNKVNKNPDDFIAHLQYHLLDSIPDFFVFRTRDINANNITSKPRFKKGDILYVKETHSIIDGKIVYRADAPASTNIKWKPSLFMKKEYARIFLQVTNVSCERLHDITATDAINEGIDCKGIFYKDYFDDTYFFSIPEFSFNSLWVKINGQDSFNSNPWVFVYEFKRIEKQIE